MEYKLTIFENERQRNFFQMKDGLNFFQMEEGADFWYATLFQPN